MINLLWILLLIALPLAALTLFLHYGYRAPRIPERGSPADHGIDYEEVAIPTRNRKRLYGWWLPVPGGEDSVIIVHGWGGNAEMMLPLALPLHRAGLNVLLIDARNHGRSDRDGVSSMPRFAEDVEAAAGWLRQAHPAQCRRLALLGHSVGAAAVLLAASEHAGIDAVIAIASFSHPRKVMTRSLRAFHLPHWLIPPMLAYVQWIIGRRFDDIAPARTACRSEAPVLLVHGDADTTVPIDDAHEIVRACPQRKLSLMVVPGAGHESVEAIREHEGRLIDFLRQQGFGLSAPE